MRNVRLRCIKNYKEGLLAHNPSPKLDTYAMSDCGTWALSGVDVCFLSISLLDIVLRRRANGRFPATTSVETEIFLTIFAEVDIFTENLQFQRGFYKPSL